MEPFNNRRIRRFWCLIVGHNVHYVSRWSHTLQGNWCTQCWYHEDDIDLDEATLPVLLNRAYRWLVERDWTWFERFDLWLMRKAWDHKWIRLPSWWEY